jgi:hypothetical protein
MRPTSRLRRGLDSGDSVRVTVSSLPERLIRMRFVSTILTRRLLPAVLATALLAVPTFAPGQDLRLGDDSAWAPEPPSPLPDHR